MPSRRRFLLSTAGLIATTPLAGSWASKSGAHPFSLGVASGCPREDRVTLWTRVAPAPLEGGGATKTDLKLRCRVCLDPGLRHSVIDRVVTAPAEDAHSVHFTASGLKPYTEYFYQFYLGEDASPIGRTLTAPARSDDLPLRLAFASCQHFEYGFYGAYRDMAATRPDLVVHLGDYIYEYAPTPSVPLKPVEKCHDQRGLRLAAYAPPHSSLPRRDCSVPKYGAGTPRAWR